MSLVGNLKTLSFSDLLQLIGTNKKTGMLSVTRSKQKKSLFFLNGDMISFISSDQEDWQLSQCLLRRKKIDKKELDKGVLSAKSSDRRIIDTLIESGAVAKTDVLEALQIQTEEMVFGIFGWEEAEFEFAEGKLPPPGALTLRTNTMGMIMEGAKRIDEWAELQKTLPAPDISLEPNLEPPAERGMINLTLDEYQTLLLVDGQKTVNEVILESPLGEFTTSKSLSDLISRGLVKKGEKKTGEEGKSDERRVLLEILFQLYNHCFSVVDETLARKLGRGKDDILNRLMRKQKEYHPFLWKLMKKRRLEMEDFCLAVEEIPGEIRLHRLLDSLNFALSQSLKTLRSILGENVKNSVSARIKKDVSPILDTEKSVSEKYQLSEEIHAVLNNV